MTHPPLGPPLDDDPAFSLKVANLPPPDGPLEPCARGWFLGPGSPAQRLFPNLWGAGQRTGRMALIGYLGAGLAYGGGGLVGLGVGVGTSKLLGAGAAFLARRRANEQRGRARALAGDPAELPDGTTVSLRGTVAQQPTAPSPFTATRAVLFRSRLGRADELRGMDFVIRLDAGFEVVLEARHAVLLDEPLPLGGDLACGPVLVDTHPTTGRLPRILPALAPRPSRLERLRNGSPGECWVRPGDQVEVVGQLHHAVYIGGSGGAHRGPPMRHLVRGRPEAPCLVRTLSRPQAG